MKVCPCSEISHDECLICQDTADLIGEQMSKPKMLTNESKKYVQDILVGNESLSEQARLIFLFDSSCRKRLQRSALPPQMQEKDIFDILIERER